MNILVLPGDGIGPEVVAEAIRVLQVIGIRYGHKFEFTPGHIGASAIKQHGNPLPAKTINQLGNAHATLLGAVGGVDPRPGEPRPEEGLLRLRQELGLFANIRPVKLFDALADAGPLKPEVVRGSDFVIVRELLGGLYFGQPKQRIENTRGQRAVDTMAYTDKQIERLVRYGFTMAQSRRGKLHSVDKRNVLETSRLWHDVTVEVAEEFPDVKVEHMLVDNAAMQLMLNPRQFDVIVTENTFGDILSDEAGVVASSPGMLPSASLAIKSRRRGQRHGLYEPIHGAAPDIANRNIANPLAAILSAAMMLELSFNLPEAKQAIEAAVAAVLAAGYRTKDIMVPSCMEVTTSQMGTLVVERLKE